MISSNVIDIVFESYVELSDHPAVALGAVEL